MYAILQRRRGGFSCWHCYLVAVQSWSRCNGRVCQEDNLPLYSGACCVARDKQLDTLNNGALPLYRVEVAWTVRSLFTQHTRHSATPLKIHLIGLID